MRANDPVLARQTRLTLEPGGNLALTRDVFAGLAPGASATLAIGPLARFDVPGLLRALDRYPYGCTEQLTSRALPLLTLASVAEAAGGTPVGDTADRISDAVAAILANQSRSGGFGLWSAGGGDLWLNAYVSDFLSRAQALGHAIPDRAMTAALDNLANRVASAPDFEEGGEGLAYALLVLAREGRAAIGDLRYFADAKADDFATPLALAQLGTALAYVADQPRADRLFAQASRTALSAEDRRGYRPDYGSLLRDQAAILSLAAEVGSTAADRTGLAEAVARGLTRPENLSTQEMLWTLKAAEAEIAALSSDGVTLNGDVVTGPLVRVLDTDSMDTVTLANDGPRPLSVIVTATGQPTEPEPAQGTGYRVERWLFTLDGDPLSPDGVAQNDRLVAVLRVTPEREAEARLMVNDPLPAGLEIDNPNLLRAGDLAQLDWLRIDDVARHTQFRADRFLAAVDWRGSDSFQLAYLVRAVSPGSFHHPAASVEDMYRPGYRARTAVGRLTVRP